MRRRDLLTGALALAAAPASARPLMPLHETPREMLSPPFVDGDGRDLTLVDFRGRVLLLNIWATWCAPCREEMPTLDRLQAQLGGDEIGIRHLGLYLAEDIRAMLAFAVIGLPTTLLIDRQGRERGRLTGPAEWDSADAIAQFQTLIAERNQ